jgi:hypothetical protein
MKIYVSVVMLAASRGVHFTREYQIRPQSPGKSSTANYPGTVMIGVAMVIERTEELKRGLNGRSYENFDVVIHNEVSGIEAIVLAEDSWSSSPE